MLSSIELQSHLQISLTPSACTATTSNRVFSLVSVQLRDSSFPILQKKSHSEFLLFDGRISYPVVISVLEHLRFFVADVAPIVYSEWSCLVECWLLLLSLSLQQDNM